MKQITARIPEDLYDEIEDEAEDTGKNKSDIIRSLLEDGRRVDELQEQIDELETERDRLQRELQAVNSRVDEHQELVEYVETERQLQEFERKSKMEKEQAGLAKRAKWFVFGRDFDDDENREE